MTIDPIGKLDRTILPNPVQGSVDLNESLKINVIDAFQKSSGLSPGIIDPGKLSGVTADKAISATFSQIKTGVKKIWELDLGKSKGPTHLEPVIHEGAIFINANGNTSKFDLDGREIWKVKTGTSGYANPAFDISGNIYVIGDECLISLDKDGNKRWKKPIGERGCSHTPVVGNDGRIYLAGDDRSVSSFSPDGNLLWKIRDKRIQSRMPVLDKTGKLHLETFSGIESTQPHLIIDTTKKNPTIRNLGEHSIHHKQVIDENGNIFGFAKGKFRATSPDRKEIWSIDLPGDTFSVNSQIGPDGNLYVGVRHHTILCLDPVTGAEKWRLSSDENKEPLSGNYAWSRDGTFYVTGDGANWKLYAINPDGSTKWIQKEPEHIANPKVSPDGVIFTGGEMRRLKAFAPDTGKRMWQFDVSLAFGDNYRITDDNDIILTTDQGKMMKIHHTTVKEAIQKAVSEAVDRDKKDSQESVPKIEKGNGWIEIGGVKLPVSKKKDDSN